MRIFSATLDLAPDVDASLYPGWSLGPDLDAALNEMGHDLVKFNWNLPNIYYVPGRFDEWVKNERTEKNKELVREVQKAHEKKKVDLFFSVTDKRFIYPETIEKIKRFGIPTLNFAPDDHIESHFMSHFKDLAMVYDYNWTAQFSSFRNYEKIGAKFIYTPWGANPHLYKPYDCKREFDVTFTGRNIGYRKELIQNIVSEGIDIRVCGYGWKIAANIASDFRDFCTFQVFRNHWQRKRKFRSLVWYITHFNKMKKVFGPPLPYEEMIRMYSRSRISLGFSGAIDMADFYKAPKSIKARDVEAPMSGAFYLTEYSDELAQLFEIGKEIETYRHISELVDKIKYYLENPAEIETIRKAGMRRALANYTWSKNFEKVFKEIGLI